MSSKSEAVSATGKGGEGGKAVKAGLGYTVGNILVKGIVFLTLPIFSRLMTTAQFGVYNVFISYESILYVLIGCAMDLSLQNAKLDYRENVNSYISSVSMLYVINSLVCCLLITVMGSWLSEVLKLEQRILYLLVVYSFSTAIISLYNMKVSLHYEYKKYLTLTLSYSIGNVLLSLLLILTVLSDRRDYGRIIGASGAVMIAALWVLYTLYKDAPPKPNREYWKYGLKYSLPLVPHGISQVLLAQFDRIMIRQMISDSAAGVYSLAANIKLVLTVITHSITSAWRTWFFNAMHNNRVKEIQTRARQLVEMYMILAVGAMSVSHELVLILGGRNYDEAKYVAIPMIMDAFMLFIYSVVVQGEYYTKKTHFITIGTVIATVVNIITNYIFIRKYGFVAAAYTTLFSYMIHLSLHLYISRKVTGFAIIPPRPLLIFLGIIAVDGAANIILVDKMAARWLVCLAVEAAIGLHFVKDTQILSKFLRKFKGENHVETES